MESSPREPAGDFDIQLRWPAPREDETPSASDPVGAAPGRVGGGATRQDQERTTEVWSRPRVSEPAQPRDQSAPFAEDLDAGPTARSPAASAPVDDRPTDLEAALFALVQATTTILGRLDRLDRLADGQRELAVGVTAVGRMVADADTPAEALGRLAGDLADRLSILGEQMNALGRRVADVEERVASAAASTRDLTSRTVNGLNEFGDRVFDVFDDWAEGPMALVSELVEIVEPVPELLALMEEQLEDMRQQPPPAPVVTTSGAPEGLADTLEAIRQELDLLKRRVGLRARPTPVALDPDQMSAIAELVIKGLLDNVDVVHELEDQAEIAHDGPPPKAGKATPTRS